MTDAWQKSEFELTKKKTPYILPSRVSYGMSIVRILEKIDCVIMASYCIPFHNRVCHFRGHYCHYCSGTYHPFTTLRST